MLLSLASAAVVIAWSVWGSPFLPTVAWKPVASSAPVPAILKLLLATIGLPFLLLSSTGPLLQKWYYQIRIDDHGDPPYFLYALSNAGSLVGLLSYPTLLEPFVGLDRQSWIWGGAFLFFVACCGGCAWIVHRSHRAAANPQQGSIDDGSIRPRRWLWFVLPTLGSVMLLATTNLLTQDVAPVPLLWVLPLSLYLLTFILTFQTRSWYLRGLFHPLFAAAVVVTVTTLFRGTDMHVLKQIVVFLGMLFVACMVCHGELARLKPAGRELTIFYLAIAAGGSFGGIIVGIIAPLIFPAIWEYHIGLWSIAFLLIVILLLDKQSWLSESSSDPWISAAFVVAIFLFPKCLAYIKIITIPIWIAPAYNFGIYLVVGLLVLIALSRRKPVVRSWPWYRWIVATVFLLLTLVIFIPFHGSTRHLLHRERNFYGALSVHRLWDADVLHSTVTLMHGRIAHGIQIEQDRKLATSYYDTNSGVGLAIATKSQGHTDGIRVGAIGLGAGTVAAYGRPNDVYRFYEINPAVIRLAQGADGYFTFLKDSPAKIEVVPGDARLSLEEEAANRNFQNFDVLIVDAFNGDAIPIHLLTREAMGLYVSHLRGPESIIALHISNLAVDLAPPIAALARLYGMNNILITTVAHNDAILASEWILLSQGHSLDVPEIQRAGKPMLAFGNRNDPAWTDNYSNVASLLSYSALSVKPWPRLRFR